MNKYQEALEWLENNIGWIDIVEFPEEYQEVFKELLYKETPMKPTKNDKTSHDWNTRFCPNCRQSLLFKGAGCINNYCRQKIDWDDEKENE